MTKRRIGKKIAAWLMCLAMVLSVVNLPVFSTVAHATSTISTVAATVNAPIANADMEFTSVVSADEEKYSTSIAYWDDLTNGTTFYDSTSSGETVRKLTV